MSTKTLEKKYDNLSREIAQLRSLVINIVGQKDPEGEYRPEFVKSVLKAIKEKPTYKYSGEGSLLKQLKQMK